jgi:signal transduction histidine kinase
MDPTSALNASSLSTIESSVGRRPMLVLLVLLVAGIALYFLSRANYLFFHGLVEMSSVAVAITTFSIGWHSRHISRNDSFALLAVAYLSVGSLDLLHTLTYKGMGVFPNVGVDMPTQFWIAARSLQACAYVASGLVLGGRHQVEILKWTIGFLVAAGLLGLAIWPLEIFPSCLTESGLTPFKIGAEYLISALLAVSGWLYWRRRFLLDRSLLHLLLTSIGLAILSELAFTIYQDVYGLANCVGHLLKVGSVVFVYRALVLGTLRAPYQSLFRDLSLSHQALDQELAQRRRTEEQLRAANLELDIFVRTVAHDLRSPLTVFISGAELVRRQIPGQGFEAVMQVLHGMEEKGWQMARMLEDLLQLARIGRLKQPAEMVDSAEVANRAVHDLQTQITASGSQVRVESLPEVHAHPTLIYQIWANLIGNAVRYAGGPERPIIVGGWRNSHRVRFFVRDHGPGIPAEERERLSEVFFRGVNAQGHAGTGIGLAIVQKITLLYEGRYWVEETSGGGATFWVELQDAPS